MMPRLIIDSIDDQGDRVLLYPASTQSPSERMFGQYHIITSRERAANLKSGDEIEYDDAGCNFGWLKDSRPSTPGPSGKEGT